MFSRLESDYPKWGFFWTSNSTPPLPFLTVIQNSISKDHLNQDMCQDISQGSFTQQYHSY